MKKKRVTIHIEDPKTKKLLILDDPSFGYSARSFCGRNKSGINCEDWDIVQKMHPLCKTCLRVMEAKKRRQEIVGVIEMDGNSD